MKRHKATVGLVPNQEAPARSGRSSLNKFHSSTTPPRGETAVVIERYNGRSAGQVYSKTSAKVQGELTSISDSESARLIISDGQRMKHQTLNHHQESKGDEVEIIESSFASEKSNGCFSLTLTESCSHS
jgi:hypothetical protein